MIFGQSSVLSPEEVASKKKRIQNPDGSVSTERSITIESDGGFYNIPTIYNGEQLNPQEAMMLFTFGYTSPLHEKPFKSIDEAVAYARKRSQDIGTAMQGKR